MAKKNTHTIELKLYEMNQLFNSMDPSPFNQKDLDHDAEEYIVSSAQEFPVNEPMALRIHLEEWPAVDPTDQIGEAIHNYFNYRAKMSHLEFKLLLKQGRTTLLIGLIFLGVCLILKVLVEEYAHSAWAGFLKESLTIAGWVAMWRPMQTYLYDWWPLSRREKIFQKLAKMSVKVTRHIKA